MKTPFITAVVRALVLLVVVLSLGPQASAGERCCAHCGCRDSCQKICRLVCEEKKISITCWAGKCEDFCVPGPSKPGCKHCDTVCDEDSSDPKAPCTHPKKFTWREWIPSCDAKIHTKTKLMKKVMTKTVPSYKWVVEDLCPQCEEQTELTDIPPGADVPLPLVIDAKLRYGQAAAAAVHVDASR